MAIAPGPAYRYGLACARPRLDPWPGDRRGQGRRRARTPRAPL